jgi:trigger factor
MSNMNAELIDISQCKKHLDIEIPQEVCDVEITNIAREFAKKARVPGFRPGKAPLQVVKTRYRDEIVSEMMQHLLPKYFSDAVEGRDLDVVHAPQYEKVDYAMGQPLKFKAVFEVYPKLNISNYTGIPAEEISTAVEDAEIEDSIRKLQEDAAELVTVEEDRPVREGDFAEISYQGTIENSDEPPIVGDKAIAEVGGRTTVRQFSENLVGAKAGEEKIFEVEYPHDYPQKMLSGKTVHYKVKVETVKEKKLPELNDEFAQRLGEYQTLDALRAKIRQDIEAHKKEHAQEQLRDKLLEWLENNNEFEIPQSLVERQMEIRIQRLIRDLTRQGINPQRLDVDWSKVRDDQHKQAVRDVKGSLLLDYISDKEKIAVSDAEIDAEIQKVAAETKRPAEKVKEVLNRESGMERLRGQIRNRKTLDFLQERANIQPPAK